MGTNRAMITVAPPYLSKYRWVSSMCSRLKNRESGRLNSRGPIRRPIQ